MHATLERLKKITLDYKLYAFQIKVKTYTEIRRSEKHTVKICKHSV